MAIANARLVFVGKGVVRFRYKDYTAGGTTKLMELRAEEFLRRCLLHVVPPHCVRIRHCGLLANRARQAKLARWRQLLAVAAAAAVAALPIRNAEPAPAGTKPISSALCLACGVGRLRVLEILAPHRGHPP